MSQDSKAIKHLKDKYFTKMVDYAQMAEEQQWGQGVASSVETFAARSNQEV